MDYPAATTDIGPNATSRDPGGHVAHLALLLQHLKAIGGTEPQALTGGRGGPPVAQQLHAAHDAFQAFIRLFTTAQVQAALRQAIDLEEADATIVPLTREEEERVYPKRRRLSKNTSADGTLDALWDRTALQLLPPLESSAHPIVTADTLLDYLKGLNDSGGIVTAHVWKSDHHNSADAIITEPIILRVTLRELFIAYFTLNSEVSSEGVSALRARQVVIFGPREKRLPHLHSEYVIYRQLSQVFTNVLLEQPEAPLPLILDLVSAYENLYSATCSVCGTVLSREGGFSPLERMWQALPQGVGEKRPEYRPVHMSVQSDRLFSSQNSSNVFNSPPLMSFDSPPVESTPLPTLPPFVETATCSNAEIEFQPSVLWDWAYDKKGECVKVRNNYHSITAMPALKALSFEELRLASLLRQNGLRRSTSICELHDDGHWVAPTAKAIETLKATRARHAIRHWENQAAIIVDPNGPETLRVSRTPSTASGYTSTAASSRSATPSITAPNWTQGSLYDTQYTSNSDFLGRANGMSSSMTQPSLRRRVHETPFAPRTSSPASTQLDLPVNDIPEAGAPYTSADDFVGTTIWAVNSHSPTADTTRINRATTRSTPITPFGIPRASVTPSKVPFPATFSFGPSFGTSPLPRMSGTPLNRSAFSMSDLRIDLEDDERLSVAQKQWEDARRDLSMRKAAALQAKREYDEAAKAEKAAFQEYVKVRDEGGLGK